jgi:Ca2+-binding RTX toxin-like protein
LLTGGITNVDLGYDTIRDEDGSGAIVIDGKVLYGSQDAPVAGGKWVDCLGNTYEWDGVNGSGLVINGKITVQNFKSGDLGIVLNEFPEAKIIRIDPLVIDLNGNGVELTDIENSTAYFDLDGDGIKEKVQWVNSNDGILVLDRNSDGQINGVDELFGNPSAIGFEVLKQYDNINDNVIDANDTKFNQFRVWQDYNQNGVIDDGELKSFNELNISSINLNYSSPANPDDATYGEHSVVTYGDGTTSTVTDINLAVNPTDTQHGTSGAISGDILALPQLKATGLVCDLHSAMANDSELQAVVESLTGEDAVTIYQNFDELLKLWAGVNVSSSELRGEYSAQKAAIVEKFYNRQFYQDVMGTVTENIPADIAPKFKTLYLSIKDKMFSAFVVQTQVFDCLDGIIFDDSGFSVTGDTAEISQAISDFVSTASVEDVAFLSVVLNQLKRNYVFDFDASILPDDIEQIKRDCLGYHIPIIGNSGAEGHNIILGSSGDDYITDPYGNDIYYTGDGDDTIVDHSYSNDTIYSGAGNDFIDLYTNNSEIHAGAGNDYIKIFSSIGHTTIEGGTGNDVIKTQGETTYIFNLGDGQDTITTENDSYSCCTDTIQFGEGITWDDLEFEKQDIEVQGDYYWENVIEHNLVIKIKNTDDRITVKHWFGNSEGWNNNLDYKIEQFVFSDGSVYTPADISNPDVIEGTNGEDEIDGTWQNDTIIGNQGNDVITDSDGNDTYIFNLGDGQDTITDADGVDTIIFGEGITLDDLEFVRAENPEYPKGSYGYGEYDSLLVSIKNTDDSITISNYYYKDRYNHNEDVYPYMIENIELADGTILNAADVESYRTLPLTDGDDYVYGRKTNDTYDNTDGNNTIIDQHGDDVYITGDGDDYIVDNYDNNHTDYATRYGNDEYYTGDGDDTIIDNSYGNDTVYSGAGNDSIKMYSDTAEIYAGTGDDGINVHASSSTIEGGAGNDIIETEGTSTFIFNPGDGQDTITAKNWNDNSSDYTNTIQFGDGITWDDLEFEKQDIEVQDDYHFENVIEHNLVIKIKNTDDQITIKHWFGNADDQNNDYDYKIENFVFADGTIHTHQDITPGTGLVEGTEDDDILESSSGNDTIQGLAGNDIISDAAGNDTYIFNLGDGQDTITDADGVDTIKFGEDITLEDLEFIRVENPAYTKGSYYYGAYDNLLIRIKNTDDSITISNYYYKDRYNHNEDVYPYMIENIELTDGTILNAADVESYRTLPLTDGDDYVYGTKADNTYNYTDGNNTVIDPHGDDIYITGDGDDYIVDNYDANHTDYATRYGNDQYYTGDGDDTIIDNSYGNDTVYSGAGNDSIKMYSDTAEIYAGTGDDSINIHASSSTIEGGIGNDIIETEGTSTFMFNLSDGQDTITAKNWNDNNSVYTNTIQFGEGITWDDLEFEKQDIEVQGDYYWENVIEHNLVIKIKNTDDQVTIKHWFGNADDGNNDYDYKIENFVFADGTSYTNDHILVELLNREGALIGTDEVDLLSGTAANNIFYGKNGNDVITDAFGGNDTYVFELGDGQDTISDYTGADTIRFGQGVTANDISITRKANDLVININNTEDSITVLNWGSGYNYQIEKLEFEDGTVLNNINSLVSKYIGTNNNDEIVANTQSNFISAGDGNDIINADLGNDTIIGGSGNDRLDGSYGDDTYIFNSGDGNDTISEYTGNDLIQFSESVDKLNIAVFQDGNNLIIDYGESGGQDKITILNQQNSTYTVEKLELSDGSYIANSEINQIIQNMTAYAANNSIEFTNIDSVKNNEDLMALVANS